MIETALSATGVALAAIKETTPLVNQIIGLALFIVQTTQSVRSNKEAYELLVKDVNQLSGRVLQAFEGSPEFAVQEIPAKFQPFIDALVDIKAFAVKRTERNIFARVVKSTADLDEIRIFKERLRQAIDVLGLESHITIHHMDKNIESISKQQEELLDIVKWLKIHEEKGAFDSESGNTSGLQSLGSTSAVPSLTLTAPREEAMVLVAMPENQGLTTQSNPVESESEPSTTQRDIPLPSLSSSPAPPMSTSPPPPPSSATQVVAPAFDFRGATINGEVKYTVVQGSQTVNKTSSVVYGSEKRSRRGGDYRSRRELEWDRSRRRESESE
ncbi:hypothetical protein BDN72DRAFT_881187 [Pluteus cervinus]|uniref:Uncharacterized protein n=1 Tax=Pluteus cervinus TaxID=181527 RepID=A0ACD3AI28_9AGAR|nr:hypothetical protein BDN72DRAFT_881187 [Pluteus cervinus]